MEKLFFCEKGTCENVATVVARVDGKHYCDQHAGEAIWPFFDVMRSIGGPAL